MPKKKHRHPKLFFSQEVTPEGVIIQRLDLGSARGGYKAYAEQELIPQQQNQLKHMKWRLTVKFPFGSTLKEQNEFLSKVNKKIRNLLAKGIVNDEGEIELKTYSELAHQWSKGKKALREMRDEKIRKKYMQLKKEPIKKINELLMHLKLGELNGVCRSDKCFRIIERKFNVSFNTAKRIVYDKKHAK